MDSSAKLSLPLVDINASTVEETWPLLTTAVDRADFIALDLELSGLGLHTTKKAFATDERYKLLRTVADSYSILSMGVACFQWQPKGTTPSTSIPCKTEVFNIWLLSQTTYSIDPGSAKFLIAHGFDFNKQFRSGLPYSPVGSTTAYSRVGNNMTQRLVHLFTRVLLSPAPLILHNGLVDLLFLYHSFYAPLPPTLNSFMADLSEMLGPDGLYDTKAITEYKLGEERSFLEYVYKKALIGNQRREESGVHYLELLFAEYTALPESGFERVAVLSRQPSIPISELVEIDMCPSIARHGSCGLSGCSRCHDISVAILQEEHSKHVQRLKRKRKRDHKQQKRLSSSTEGETKNMTMADQCPVEEGPTGQSEITDQCPMKDSQSETTDQCPMKEGPNGQSETKPTGSDTIANVFKRDLATARANLRQSSASDTMKPRQRSSGHRAGFDAFMTGYTFACYALGSSGGQSTGRSHSTTSVTKSEEACPVTRKETPQELSSDISDASSHNHADSALSPDNVDSSISPRLLVGASLFEGLVDTRNCLSNRGRALPMRVVHSKYAKTSEGHIAAWKKMKHQTRTRTEE